MKFPFQKEYKNLNKVVVSQNALLQNHKILQEFHEEARVSPVIKSNAYGHGISTVAPIFDSLTAPFLIVDSLYEAYKLYKLKVKTPILILGYTHSQNLKVKSLPFHFTVFDLATAVVLNQYQPGCSVHLFVDTGMSREGVTLKDFPEFVEQITQLKNLKIVGLASHFADADNPENLIPTSQQITNFKKALKILENNDIHPEWKHISASGGAFKVVDPIFTMVRAGLASYGINPLEPADKAFGKLKVVPALRFTSTLVQVKEISKGDKVGYNFTFEAKKKMKIGLIPAGYYEGIDRRLSNKGVFKIGNQYCPILGRVSMNMTVIDLTKVPDAKVGDEVVIYSEINEDKNSLVSAAQIAGTIPYEILVHLAESVKKVLI